MPFFFSVVFTGGPRWGLACVVFTFLFLFHISFLYLFFVPLGGDFRGGHTFLLGVCVLSDFFNLDFCCFLVYAFLMKKRMKFPRKKSRKDYKRKSGIHPKNTLTPQMTQRGGIRL